MMPRMLAPAIVLAGLSLAGSAGTAEPVDWDVTRTYGDVRNIDFVTDEGTDTSVDSSPDGKWLAFDLLGNVYRIPSTGGDAELLTRNAGQSINYHPRYSPDGALIAFISDRGGENNLWLMNSDGSSPRPLVLDLHTRFAQPTWTPDGKSIVVQRIYGVPGEGMERRILHLWIYSVATGEGRELTGKPGEQTSWPSVSPDGRYVYYDNSNFESEEYSAYHLERLALGSGEIEEITARESTFRPPTFRVFRMPEFQPADSFAPEVSPDGHYLAFARRIIGGETSIAGHPYSKRTALWLRDLESGTERVLMDPIDPDRTGTYARGILRVVNGYCWQKDSKALIVPVNGKLRRVEVATGEVTTIPFRVHVHRQLSQMARAHVDLSGSHFRPKFLESVTTSPDGEHVAFYAAGQVWIKSRGGASPRALPRMPDHLQLMPSWSPDGRWLAFVTWKDGELGHVWKVAVPNGRPIRLTREAGEYLYPTWSPDGRQIAVVSGSLETRRGDTLAANRNWYVRMVSAAGGTASIRAELPMLGPLHWNRDGRLYYLDTASHVPALLKNIRTGRIAAKAKVLTSIDALGHDVRHHALLAERADDAILAGDGAHLLYHAWFNVYLATMPQGESLPSVDFYDGEPAAHVIRLSAEGGWYPHWRNARIAEFINGTRHYSFDVETRTPSEETIELSVPRAVAAGRIALSGATIISMAEGQKPSVGTVVIENGRIVCIFECTVEPTDERIDVSGKFIIPGLVDVHNHFHQDGWVPELASRHHPNSALLLAYGVTTAVNPYGVPTVDPRYADLTMSGRWVGPRYLYTSFGVHDNFPEEHIETYADAVRIVDLHAAYGAIGIKNFHMTNRRQSQMLIVAAQRHGGLYVTAEQGDLDYVIGLVLDGQTGWEHMLSYDTLHKDVVELFGRAHVTYSPTLIVGGLQFWGSEYFLPRYKPWQDPKYTRFIPWQWLRLFPSFAERPQADFSFPFMAESVAAIVRAGGNAAIGAHGEIPGMGDHFEMQMYGTAMTPEETLHMATLGGARFTGLDPYIGSLEVGKFGDLIVLNSDPLQDVHHTLDMRYVMKDGVLYDSETLDELWPRQIPYGPVPWTRAGDLGPRDRPLDFWDQAH
jgi:Tol biopolymer transport system component